MDPKTTKKVSFVVTRQSGKEKSVEFKSLPTGEWELTTPINIVTRKLYEI